MKGLCFSLFGLFSEHRQFFFPSDIFFPTRQFFFPTNNFFSNNLSPPPLGPRVFFPPLPFFGLAFQGMSGHSLEWQVTISNQQFFFPTDIFPPTDKKKFQPKKCFFSNGLLFLPLGPRVFFPPLPFSGLAFQGGMSGHFLEWQVKFL